MSRLHTLGSEATGRTAELFAAIKSKLGKVPNAYDAIGSNSPVALEALLGFDAKLADTSLSKQEIEVIKLAVSEVNGCDYCLAAHTLAGRAAGLSAEAMLAARRGTPGGNDRLDALSTFVRAVAGSRRQGRGVHGCAGSGHDLRDLQHHVHEPAEPHQRHGARLPESAGLTGPGRRAAAAEGAE